MMIIVTTPAKDLFEILPTWSPAREKVFQRIGHWVLPPFRLLPTILVKTLGQVNGNIRTRGAQKLISGSVVAVTSR